MITTLKNRRLNISRIKPLLKKRSYNVNIPFFKDSIKNIISNTGRDHPYQIKVPQDRRTNPLINEMENDSLHSLKNPLPSFSEAKFMESIPKHSNSITSISTLPNNMIVASEDIPSEMAALGLFVKSGHRYESDEEFGISFLLQKLAFKSTKNRTSQQLLEELEFMGVHVNVNTSADILIYSAEVLRRDIDKTIELLNDAISNPLFTDEDLEISLALIEHELLMAQTDFDSLLADRICCTAYSNSNLGRSIYDVPIEHYSSITRDKLYNYMRKYFVGSRMILAGCGTSHEELVSVANKHLSHFPKDSPVDIPDTPPGYTGGVNYIPVEDLEHAIVSLYFEISGIQDPDCYLYFFIYTMLGGGGSFSSGGPGKGLYTRLYLNVLNRYMGIESCESNIISFKDTGLLGIQGKCDPDMTNNFLTIMANEMIKITKGMDPVEFTRVKNQMKTSIFYNLESRPILLDDIGRQVFMLGKRFSADELCDMIDKITVDDIIRCTRKLLSSNPTVVVFAPQNIIDNLPSEQDFQYYFKSKLE